MHLLLYFLMIGFGTIMLLFHYFVSVGLMLIVSVTVAMILVWVDSDVLMEVRNNVMTIYYTAIVRRCDVNYDVTSTQCLLLNDIVYLKDLFTQVPGLYHLLFGFENWRGWFFTDLKPNNMNVLHLSHVYVFFSDIYRWLSFGLCCVLNCTELHCSLLWCCYWRCWCISASFFYVLASFVWFFERLDLMIMRSLTL